MYAKTSYNLTACVHVIQSLTPVIIITVIEKFNDSESIALATNCPPHLPLPLSLHVWLNLRRGQQPCWATISLPALAWPPLSSRAAAGRHQGAAFLCPFPVTPQGGWESQEGFPSYRHNSMVTRRTVGGRQAPQAGRAEAASVRRL